MKFFGTTAALGKAIQFNGDIINRPLTVTGVLKDITTPHHLQFDILLPFSLYQQSIDYDGAWDNYDVFTYIQTNTSNLAQLTTAITDYIRSRQPKTSPIAGFTLQPIAVIHLYSGLLQLDVDNQGNIQHVRIFSLIAIFILGIAIGAPKGQLILQFIGESVLLSMISLILAFIGTSIFAPLLNIPQTPHLLLFIGIAFITGVVAGSIKRPYARWRKLGFYAKWSGDLSVYCFNHIDGQYVSCVQTIAVYQEPLSRL